MHEAPPNPTPPDPAQNYERADPKRESPQGTMEKPDTSPVARPDRMEQSVPQRQKTDEEFDTDQLAPGPNARNELSEKTSDDPHRAKTR
jgi:hypothetical protein